MLALKLASDSGTEIEHLPFHSKVEGSSAAAPAGTRKEKNGKEFMKKLASSSSTVVEHLTHQPKVKGLSPATVTENGIESMTEKDDLICQ
jgi:hypothetical protein